MPKGKKTDEGLMSKAVQAVMTGDSERQAARKTGVSKTAIHNAIVRLREGTTAGELDLWEQRILAGAFEISARAGHEIVGRLETDPESFSPKELNILWGTSTDKIAANRGWGKGADKGASDWTSALAKALGPSGGKVTLTVETEPPKDSVQVIDVESVPETEDR